MEFEKNLGNFSFGFGNEKTAGKGKLSDAVKIKSRPDAKAVRKKNIENGLKAGAAVAALLVTHSMKKHK